MACRCPSDSKASRMEIDPVHPPQMYMTYAVMEGREWKYIMFIEP